jgi:hypothetical protein
MTDVVRERFIKFLEEADQAAYRELFDAVTSSDEYDPYARDLQGLDQMVRQGDAAGVLARSEELLPRWVLSPRFHWLRAAAHGQVGDAEEAETDRAIAHALLLGIQGSGDGSEQSPFVVSCLSDEYDLLMCMGKQVRGQGLGGNGRACDRLTCEDGSVVWFDISAPLKRVHRAPGMRGGR